MTQVASAAIFAFAAIRYGSLIFDYAVDWSQQGMEWFVRQIEE